MFSIYWYDFPMGKNEMSKQSQLKKLYLYIYMKKHKHFLPNFVVNCFLKYEKNIAILTFSELDLYFKTKD